MNSKPTKRPKPSEPGAARPSILRRRAEPTMTDRILDYPYGKLFGWVGQLVIASVVLVGLVVKFITGIDSVALDMRTCELAWYDGVYKPFHKDRILANTRRDLNKLMVEKQTMLYQINLGRNPYASSTDGNVVGGRKINKDKFFWKASAENLKKDRLAIGNCLRRLPAYDFG